MTVMLEAQGVSKMFGHVRALNDVHLALGPGVTGLLGPNGSGKSTLLKLLSGQLVPDEGRVRLLGRDPFRSPACLRELGLCPEQDKFYEELRGFDFIEALTRLHGLSRAESEKATYSALERVGMASASRMRLREMSRGMRQRIKIAQAIAHDPRIVLLDEPLTGADPVARADLISLIKGLGQEGRCVVVSSHVLHEVEAMTHDVVFIRFGRLRAQGDILHLRAQLTDIPYRIQCRLTLPVADEPASRRYAARVVGLEHVQGAVVLEDDLVEVTTLDLERAARELPQAAVALGGVIEGFTSPDADLESLYRYLMGPRSGGVA